MQGLTLQRQDAIDLLNACGLHLKPGTSNADLAKRIASMPKWLEDDAKPEDDQKAMGLLEQVYDAVDAGIDITVEGDAVKAPKQKPSKNGDGKKARAKDDEVEKDALGFRVGTIPAKVNEVILKANGKYLAMSEIVERAGLKGTAYEHCNKMVKKGVFIKEDGKYALAEKTTKAPKKTKKLKA